MVPALCTALAGLLPPLLRCAWPCFFQDLRFALTMVRVARRAREAGARSSAALLDVLAQRARRTPHKPLVLLGGAVCTDEQMARRSSQAARRAGGCLALFTGNRPACLCVCVWLGCAKLGRAVACLNSSVRAASLLRCWRPQVRAAGGQRSRELKEAVEEILPSLKKENVKVYYLSKTSEGVESFLDKVDAASDESTPLSWRSDITFKTPAMYIYTSGTTGLPKAAVINHEHIMLACGLFDAGNVTSEDTVYTALPLYHSSALLVGVHGCIVKGAVSRSAKTSGSRDGSLIRSQSAKETQSGKSINFNQHKALYCVPTQCLYRLSAFHDLGQFFPYRLSAFHDLEWIFPYCFYAAFPAWSARTAYHDLQGMHTSPQWGRLQACKQQLANIPPRPGLDSGSRSLRKGSLKGEKKKRFKVRYELQLFAVIIPSGYEGKTGMACIRLKENSEFNGESAYRHVNTHLPSYARPHFIRIKSAIELTATFKYRKVQLVEEGFDPAIIKDHLYFLDDKENLYVQMTQDIYNSVKNHDFKL
ncbi:LOW QUALITY PROTEIN: long-chain fatty acid transport protein 2 [Podargus strigoides]